jgi:hypothetical protein
MPYPPVMLNVCRAIIGNVEHPKLVLLAAILVVVWIIMDVLQFVDWISAHFGTSVEFPT